MVDVVNLNKIEGMKFMNKTDLIEAIAESADLTKNKQK